MTETSKRRRETPQEKLIRLTQIETPLWEQGLSVAGIDEVGRGPLAGPVVTACVCIPRGKLIPGVDENKTLTEQPPEQLNPMLNDAADYAKTCVQPPAVIDHINILEATRQAMETCAADFCGIFLVDAVQGLHLPGETRSIIHGDALSYMIGAASIVAKVERDRYMIALDEKYPMYGFARNKGYGTKEHIEALRKYGPCPEHRRTFIRNYIQDDE